MAAPCTELMVLVGADEAPMLAAEWKRAGEESANGSVRVQIVGVVGE